MLRILNTTNVFLWYSFKIFLKGVIRSFIGFILKKHFFLYIYCMRLNVNSFPLKKLSLSFLLLLKKGRDTKTQQKKGINFLKCSVALLFFYGSFSYFIYYFLCRTTTIAFIQNVCMCVYLRANNNKKEKATTNFCKTFLKFIFIYFIKLFIYNHIKLRNLIDCFGQTLCCCCCFNFSFGFFF